MQSYNWSSVSETTLLDIKKYTTLLVGIVTLLWMMCENLVISVPTSDVKPQQLASDGIVEGLSRNRNQRYRRCIIKTGSMSWPLMLLKVFPKLNMCTRLHSRFDDSIHYCVALLFQLAFCMLCNSSLSRKCNLGNTNWGQYLDTCILKKRKVLLELYIGGIIHLRC